MARPEHRLMQACAVFAAQVLPPDADYAAVETKIGKNDMMAAVWRKQAGVKAGEPDARIVYRGRVTFFEMKAGASVSAVQHARHAELRAAGADVFVVRSVAALAALWRGMGIILRHHSITPERRDEMLAARQAKPAKTSKPRSGRAMAQIKRVGRMRGETMF